MFAHDFLNAYVDEILGRRIGILAPLKESLIMPLTIGLADQLSVYMECRSGVRLSVGAVQLREHGTRAHLFAALMDRKRALRLQSVLPSWQPRCDTSRVDDFVAGHVARRWRFIEGQRRFLERLFSKVGDALVGYYVRNPVAKLDAASSLIRLMEGVDCTWLTCDLADRGEAPGERDSAARYRVE